MADGSPIIEVDVTAELNDSGLNRWWRATVEYRNTPFIAIAIFVFVILTGVLFTHEFAFSLLDAPTVRAAYGWSWTLFALPLVLLLRDPPENLGRGPGYALPFTCLGLLAALAGYSLAPQPTGWIRPDAWLVSSALMLVFVPLVWNAANFWVFHNRRRAETARALSQTSSATNEANEAEAISALIATGLIALIVAGMAWIGQNHDTLHFNAMIGVVLSGLVAGVFFVVIFMDWLSELSALRNMSHGLRWVARRVRFLAVAYNSVDTVLVRIGAPIAGAEHRHPVGRYAIQSILLVSLSVLSWQLSPGLGLLTGFIGLTFALSISRLWSWVEDDRALASATNFDRTAPYRTDMREDYRDETLLGFIFVLALMPIMMAQANASELFGKDMFALPTGQVGLFDWFGFFGVELAKAVPLVDWIDIYTDDTSATGGMISALSPAARHSVFFARATVDLVLIAALLQAISIFNRNRQQKRLFNTLVATNAGHPKGLIDRLDEFVERVELRRAIAACRRPGSPALSEVPPPAQALEIYFDLNLLSDPRLIDFRRYNSDRLLELYGEQRSLEKRTFIAALACQRGDMTLKSPMHLLSEYAEDHRNEYDLYRVLGRVINDLDANRPVAGFDAESLRTIMLELRATSGLQDFKHKLLDLFVRVGGPADERIAFVADIAGLSDPDSFQGVRAAAIGTIADIVEAERSLDLITRTRGQLTTIRRGAGPTVIAAIAHARQRLNALAQKLRSP